MTQPLSHDKLAEVQIVGDEHATPSKREAKHVTVLQSVRVIARYRLDIMAAICEEGGEPRIDALVKEELHRVATT